MRHTVYIFKESIIYKSRILVLYIHDVQIGKILLDFDNIIGVVM